MRLSGSPRRALPRWAWLVPVLVLAACAPEQPSEPLEAIPHPELGAAEVEVRRQLESARAAVEETLADPERSLADKAVQVGELGELYHAYDLTEAAAAAYRNAHRLDGDEPRWPYLLGVLHRYGGDPEPAVANLEVVLGLSPDDLAARLHLGMLELDRGGIDEAAVLAEEILAADPGEAAAQALAGRVAVAREDYATAVHRFEQALELQPSANRLEYLLGQAHRQLGDLDAARRHLRRQGGVEVVFEDPRLASIYTRLAGSAALMQRGASAKEAGLLDASLETYRRAVAGAPRSPEARRDLGALLAQTGRYIEAVDQYREAVRLEPDKGLNHFVLALVLEQVGEPGGAESAIASIGRAVDLEPDYREFRFALASRLARSGRFADARDHFDRLLDQDRRDTDVRLERAKVRLELGDAIGALDDARAVEAEAPRPRQQAEALALVGTVQARQGDAQSAAATLRQALDLEPELVEARFSFANLLGMAGDFETAAGHYRFVTEREPERTTAWLGEATALALQGQEAEAAARLELGIASASDGLALRFALTRLLLGATDPQVLDPPRALGLARGLLAEHRSREHGELLVMALGANEHWSEAADLQRSLLQAVPPGTDPALLARWRAQLADLERRRP